MQLHIMNSCYGKLYSKFLQIFRPPYIRLTVRNCPSWKYTSERFKTTNSNDLLRQRKEIKQHNINIPLVLLYLHCKFLLHHQIFVLLLFCSLLP